MRTFAILLLCVNLGYLFWNLKMGAFKGGASTVVIRTSSKQAPENLVLISEVPNNEVKSSMLMGEEERVPEGEIEGELNGELKAAMCVSFGTFLSDEASNLFVEEVLGEGYVGVEEVVEIDDGPDFWVHIPPIEALVERQAVLDDLSLNNLDGYVITGGEIDQGISLGLFGFSSQAVSFQKELELAGFASSIIEIASKRSEKWVSVQNILGDSIPESERQIILERHPELKQEEKLCETIAPEL